MVIMSIITRVVITRPVLWMRCVLSCMTYIAREQDHPFHPWILEQDGLASDR